MIDLFEPRTMLAALEERFPPKMFLRDTFFNGQSPETWPSQHIDIDVFKGARRVAPYVHPMAEGKVVERAGFQARTYTPPYIKPKMVTTAQNFLTRGIGENIYGSSDGPEQRAQAQLGKDLAELEDMILRRQETQAAELLETGKVTITGDGVSDLIDFAMSASHIVTLSGTDLWDNASSQPLAKLRALKRIVAKDSGLVPDVCVMGENAIDAFLANANVKDQLDTRRIDLGIIDPRELAEGVTYYGRIKDVSLDLYTYEEYYIHPTTTVLTNMVPAKKIFLGSTRARTSTNYGAIQDLDAGSNFVVPMFPKSWRTKDPSAQWLLLQSAPLLAMHQVDAFLVAQVLA